MKRDNRQNDPLTHISPTSNIIPTFTAKLQKNSRNPLIQKGLRLFHFVMNM
jgi:uncharacterized alpha/beta hydrolase family protein